MPLIAVGILHTVATKKGRNNPALLASEAVFCSRRKIPRLSRKMCLRARIYALYGRSVRARGMAVFCMTKPAGILGAGGLVHLGQLHEFRF